MPTNASVLDEFAAVCTKVELKALEYEQRKDGRAAEMWELHNTLCTLWEELEALVEE